MTTETFFELIHHRQPESEEDVAMCDFARKYLVWVMVETKQHVG